MVFGPGLERKIFSGAPKTAREARALLGTEKFAGEGTRRFIGILAKMCKILFDPPTPRLRRDRRWRMKKSCK
jgi:hypothetical protein